MIETLKHKEAYEFYYTLGDKRSYLLVARQFTVSTTSVKKWAVAFNWQRRILERDRELGQRLEKVTNKSIVEEKARLLSVVKGSLNKFIERLKSGAIVPNSIADLDRLVKLYLLLLEQNAEPVISTEKRIEEMTPEEQQQRMREILSKIIRDKNLLDQVLNQYNNGWKPNSSV